MATTTTLSKSGLFSACGLQLPFYFFKETTTSTYSSKSDTCLWLPVPQRGFLLQHPVSPPQRELSVFFRFMIYFMCMDGSPASTADEQMEERTPAQAGRELGAVTLRNC